MKVIDQIWFNGDTIITLDEKPNDYGKHVRIDGKIYETKVIFDIPNSVGVRVEQNFLGKDVEFIE